MQQQNKIPRLSSQLQPLPQLQPQSQSQSQLQQNPTISLIDTTLLFYRRNSEHKRKNLDQILQKLHKNQYNSIQSQTTLLKRHRHKIQKQLTKVYYKPIEQQQMKPGDAVLRIFSNMKPINTGDRFIDEKERAKLVFSNRMFNRKPNVVTGVYQKRVQTQNETFNNIYKFTQKQMLKQQGLTQNNTHAQIRSRIKTEPLNPKSQRQITQNKDWISRKFSQYDRIVTQQTGPLRLLHKKLSQVQNGIQCKHSIMSSVNRNQNQLFSAFQSSKNDFYYDRSHGCGYGYEQGKQNTVSTNAFSFRSSMMVGGNGSGRKGQIKLRQDESGRTNIRLRLRTQIYENSCPKTNIQTIKK